MLFEEKVVVKNMMLIFVDWFLVMVFIIDNYQCIICGFLQQISQVGNIVDLNSVFSEIMIEMQKVQEEVICLCDVMVDVCQEVEKVEECI